MFNIEYLGNLDKPFNFLIRSRKQPYNNTTGYERSETETRSMEIFTRFLGTSAMKVYFQLPSDDGSCKIFYRRYKILQCRV